MSSMGAMAGAGLGPVWAIMVGGLEVDQPRESLVPSLFEVGGKKVADEGVSGDDVKSGHGCCLEACSSLALSGSCRVCAGLCGQDRQAKTGRHSALRPAWL